MTDYLRVAVAVPELEVGNPTFNVTEIKSLIAKANDDGVKIIIFPELCLTGYTASDLFHQQLLIDKAEEGLESLMEETRLFDMLIAVGLPIEVDNQLFNVAALFHQGVLLGVVPKTFIPNYNEFYEHRWFASAKNRKTNTVCIAGQTAPFGERLLFKDEQSKAIIGVELCEDLWMPIPPSAHHALNGANVLLNLSASNEMVGKSDYRRDLVRVQSAKTISAYLYASAGQSESTTDVVFSGHAMIAENGTLLKEQRFEPVSSFVCADIDVERLRHDRTTQTTFMEETDALNYQFVSFSLQAWAQDRLARWVDPHPFIPSNTDRRNERCEEIFRIQATGLAQRLKKTRIPKVVVGISGGLDSTLALLVMIEAFRMLDRPLLDIIGVTMPGFGTTNRTYQNAVALMQRFGISQREVSIRFACEQHFKDIGHNPDVQDVTFENIQARERTQILMDIANQENGLVVGTGDLSELALGWATYNGDHMSMYAVNTGVPKTLVRYVVEWVAETTEDIEVARLIQDICATPVSPELIASDGEGQIQQKTEDILGAYELHDFFLYHMVRFGSRPMKIFTLAVQAFDGKYTTEKIKEALGIFYRRFFSQQFKRSCLPDGIKVGSVSLSPRGDWRMPSDASVQIWLDDLK